MRRVVAALVVVGLAIAVVLLWPRSDPEEPPIAEATTTSSTSTTEPSTTTSTTAGTTSTTVLQNDRTVETVEEAEEILRELWFGWFEGIYNQDEERIREVVATEQFLRAGIAAFDTLRFVSEPTLAEIDLLEVDLLMSTSDCLAIWSVTESDFLEVEEARSGVEVLRYSDGAWRFASSWKFRDDLWEADCTAELLPLP
jgi:hypothetical protein